MRTFLNNGQSDQPASVWGQLLRYAMVLAMTTVLFGSLYFGIISRSSNKAGPCNGMLSRSEG